MAPPVRRRKPGVTERSIAGMTPCRPLTWAATAWNDFRLWPSTPREPGRSRERGYVHIC